MVLDGFNDISEFEVLEHLLGHDHVEVVEGDHEVVKVACILLKGSGVAEGTLVVRDGPLGGAHNSQVVVHVRVEGTDEGVLRREAS